MQRDLASHHVVQDSRPSHMTSRVFVLRSDADFGTQEHTPKDLRNILDGYSIQPHLRLRRILPRHDLLAIIKS
jgi:hypothetical protein